MQYTTTVRLVLEGTPAQPIPGVMVSLYDHDRFGRDDFLGTEMTNTDGEARFRFTSDHFTDVDERLGGVMPDLYAKVFDAQGTEVLCTRAETIFNAPVKQITVPVSRELAERHGLVKRPVPVDATES